MRETELEKAGFTVNSIGVSTERLRKLLGDPKAPVTRTRGWCTDWPGGGSVFPAQWGPRSSDAPGAPNPSPIDAPEVAADASALSATAAMAPGTSSTSL